MKKKTICLAHSQNIDGSTDFLEIFYFKNIRNTEK